MARCLARRFRARYLFALSLSPQCRLKGRDEFRTFIGAPVLAQEKDARGLPIASMGVGRMDLACDLARGSYELPGRGLRDQHFWKGYHDGTYKRISKYHAD